MGIFSMVLSLLSGVALFLFGMSLMGDGLKLVAGNKLESFLIQNDQYATEGSRTWYSRYKRYPVFRSNDCHGYRFC